MKTFQQKIYPHTKTRISSSIKTKSSFSVRVYDVVSKIPKGKVLTYVEVAKRIGSPLAARAVGNILHGNKDPKIPCHRVIRSDGNLGGYNRGAIRKRAILKREGAI